MQILLYILGAVVAAVVTLLLIAVIRTAAIKAKPNTDKTVISYTEQEENEYASKLSEMIKVPTISLRGQDDLTQFRILQDKMKELFPLVHEKMERVDIDGNLLYRWKSAHPERDGLLLMGHQDVVTATEKEWEHEPFSGDIENGIIHGRGSMDCKCTVMAEFQAIEELMKEGFEPERDIYLASSVNEEISGGGAIKTVEYLKSQGKRMVAVMDEGGAVLADAFPGLKGYISAIGIVEKGYADIKITAKGNGGHSSTPPKNTPVARLAAFVNEMETKRPFDKKLGGPVKAMFTTIAPHLTFPLRLVLGNLWLFKPVVIKVLPALSSFGEAFLSTTFAFTMCEGSQTPNVIPDQAYVICNIRPSIHQNSAQSVEIIKKIAAKYDLEVEVIYSRDASGIVDINGEEFKYMVECASKCYPDAVPTPYFMFGGTDCRYYEEVSDNCLRICPIRLSQQQLKAMHAANENINTSALAESVKFYKHYVKNHS